MVQKIGKYIKLHVLGDFGDIWIGISEDIQKIDFSSHLRFSDPKNDFKIFKTKHIHSFTIQF